MGKPWSESCSEYIWYAVCNDYSLEVCGKPNDLEGLDTDERSFGAILYFDDEGEEIYYFGEPNLKDLPLT